RLAARAQAAPADRIRREPLELLRDAHLHDSRLAVARRLDVGLHHPHVHRAPGAARRADARLPFGDAGHEILAGNEANDLVLRVAAARQRGAGPGDRRQLDEIASIHGLLRFLPCPTYPTYPT